MSLKHFNGIDRVTRTNVCRKLIPGFGSCYGEWPGTKVRDSNVGLMMRSPRVADRSPCLPPTDATGWHVIQWISSICHRYHTTCISSRVSLMVS